MAQFRGTIQGQRGMASRLGSKNSGLEVSCDGWNSGVTVSAYIGKDGKDHFTISLTGGSGGFTPAGIRSYDYDGVNFRQED